MNNEEKKPLSNESEPENSPSANEASSPESKTGSGFLSSLSKNAKIAIIAAVGCVAVAVVALALILAGGKNNGGNGDGGGTGDGGTENGGGNNGNQSSQVTYNVNVVTNGGMKFANLPIYIHNYVDGYIEDIVASALTDAEGKASFTLPAGEYAANVSIGMPEGYDVLGFYPLVSENFEIKVTSAILPDVGLSGVSYTLGSVIHDFTFNTTVLVEDGEGNLVTEDRVFTLSEVLKEKDAVLINFWGTDCSWCVKEFPLMHSAYEKYKDDIAVLAIDPPAYYEDTKYDVEAFQRSYGLTFNMGLDDIGLFNAFLSIFQGGETGLPVSAMVDRYGVITFIEPGAITSERVFDVLFDHFTGDEYNQILIENYMDIVPREKPDVQMPSSEEISNVFDKGSIDGIEYLPYPDDVSDEEKEYSWPFVIDKVKFGDDETEYDVIKTSNANKENSFAQIIFNVNLKAGEVLAFDYYSFTERGADILYVVVDGKDIYSISGQNEDGWETCYAFVAEEDGTYEVGMVYSKDSDTNYEHDTVFLKDLRIVTEQDIDSPTYIYRFAATKPDGFGAYSEYAELFLGKDGYYHVGSANGPILLADLMGYTRFSSETNAYTMVGELLLAERITEAQYDKFIDYCSYASNSNIYGVSSVTPELKEMLDILSLYCGDPSNENDWLRFCCYYDAYGTDGGQLEDPIKGLALFSAYDVILSDKGDKDFPNKFVYNKVIMPRGLLAKFTPSVSGTYLISSYAPDPNNEGYGIETNAWVFTASDFAAREPWYSYENIDRLNTTDVNNCYMILYLEAGKDYYIDIAFYDVYQEGEVFFRVECLGGEGSYRFSQASPGPFTSLIDPSTGALTETIIKGIAVTLDNEGFYREDRTDGRLGSLIYADFTQTTLIFQNNVIYYGGDDPKRVDMIEAGAFNFKYSEQDLYVLNYLAKVGGDIERCKAELLAELGEAYAPTYMEESYDGSYYSVKGYAVDEVLAGIYHGTGEDETDTMREYAANIIKVGDTITVVNEDGTGTVEIVVEEGDPRIGCVAVDENLARILQLLVDKYTFEGVENSWLKLCFYDQHFNAATPK